MAVKQNNTDENSLNGSPGVNTSAASTNSPKATNGMTSNNGINTAGCNGSTVSTSSYQKSGKQTELSKILKIIELVSDGNTILSNEEYAQIYGDIIFALAKVPTPREDFQRYIDDLIKVGEFFTKANESHQTRTHMCLHIVYKLITSDETPSCAIAVVFQLFTEEMVLEAVQALLLHNIQDHIIKKTVKLLCESKLLNLCQNLNLWILAILKGLKDQNRFELLNEIAMEIIERLFKTLMVPILRPKIMHLVFPILDLTKQNPDVFHKVVPCIPMVVYQLKKQSAQEEYTDDASRCLQNLVDLSTALITVFPRYDEFYKPVIDALSDFNPSYDCLTFFKSNHLMLDEGPSLVNSNAKVGLVNLGNTCYMNSVLQSLVMTKQFSREILLLSGSKSPLLVKLQELFALMLHSKKLEITPTSVLDATRTPTFTPGLQHDSSEFLGYLLDTLHEQELSYRGSASTTNAIMNDGARMQDKYNKHNSLSNETQDEDNTSQESVDALQSNLNQTQYPLPTAIETSFMGKLATTYKCLTCSWQSTNIDSFRDLQLSFPEVDDDSISKYTVQDLLDYYCSSEKLHGDNQYFCERCKKLSDAERLINVIRAPKNLILTLKHFKYDQSNHLRAKLMHKVFHDEHISVKICSAEALSEIASVHYNIYAGVVHSGCSMDSGHYYTYAADSNNKWYKFNDEIVTPCNVTEINDLTPPHTPYILFYQMDRSETLANPTTVLKIDAPPPLKLDELPPELREHVNHHNTKFKMEQQSRQIKMINTQTSPVYSSRTNYREDDPDDDDDQSAPPNGCGSNALNVNVNRFVF